MKKLLMVCCAFVAFFCSSQNESKLLKEGADLFYQEDYGAALKVFQKESKKNNSFETQFWIASCYFKMEEFPIAKERFLAIVNSSYLGVEVEMSMGNLGTCYRELGKVDSSYYYYDWAIKLDPESAVNYFNMAQLNYSQSKFDEAKREYSTAIILDSTDALYYVGRQEISFILHQYSDAMEDMLKAKKLEPDLDIEFNMAYCYSMMERYKEADSLYQKIYDPKSALFLNNYGFNKHKLGQSEEGVELIKKSIKLDSDNSYAYRNLAIIEIDNGNMAKACEYLLKSKELKFFSKYGSEVDQLLLEHCK